MWDDDEEKWVLKKRTEDQGLQIRSQRPQSALGTRSHQTRHAIINANRGNARYKCENIITLELEMPRRTTVDYDPGCFNGELYHEGYDPQGYDDYQQQYEPQYEDQQYGGMYQ